MGLHLPTIGEIADSSVLADALRAAADTARAYTSIKLTYRPDGTLKDVATYGTRSAEARRKLETAGRQAARPLLGVPVQATVTVARRNADDHLRLAFLPATCPVWRGSIAEAAAFVEQRSRPFAGAGRSAVVEFELAPTGEIGNPHIFSSSGVPWLDSLALLAVRKIQFKPALVGRTPVASIVRIGINF